MKILHRLTASCTNGVSTHTESDFDSTQDIDNESFYSMLSHPFEGDIFTVFNLRSVQGLEIFTKILSDYGIKNFDFSAGDVVEYFIS
jgi:hypothetical protein